MRLKEDSSSYNAIGLKKKYDQPLEVGHRSKKKTTKWCKGKIGIEHEWEHIVPKNSMFQTRKMDVCKNCGKQSYKNVTWWCREHKTWDKKIWWNSDHTHESVI